MDFPGFLAMTGAEIAHCTAFPPHIAYMSCHFSPFGAGISALPAALPPGSVLMLTDRTPIAGHDPCLVAQQLQEAAGRLGCSAVVLDLQRESPEAGAVVAAVVATGLAVAVSERYAEGFDCAVLVASPRLWTPLREALMPWEGRSIWLETTLDSALVRVTAEGSCYEPFDGLPSCPKTDEGQHVLYEESCLAHCAEYRLWREESQLAPFMEEARQLGVDHFLGLYQQLAKK